MGNAFDSGEISSGRSAMAGDGKKESWRRLGLESVSGKIRCRTAGRRTMRRAGSRRFGSNSRVPDSGAPVGCFHLLPGGTKQVSGHCQKALKALLSDKIRDRQKRHASVPFV